MMFRRKPSESEGYPVRERKVVRTLHGELVVRPGDWVLYDLTGMEYPVRKEVFSEIYEPIDNDAKLAWRKVYGEEYKDDKEEEICENCHL